MSRGARGVLLLVLLLSISGPVAQAAASGDFAGLVNIGGDRKMYLECGGKGSPTVVLIAGGFEAGWIWSYALDPADPVHAAPDDTFGAGAGDPQKRETAVFPTVSKLTRVCLYDRPNTTVGHYIMEERAGQISTPMPQPHKLENDIADLHALLTTAGEPGPYVLVGHSYGGMIAELYARRYPKDVAGQVLLDVTSVYLRDTFTPEEYDEFVAKYRVPPAEGSEAPELDDAIDTILAAPPAPLVPAVLFTADKLDKGALPTRRAELLEAHNRLAAHLGAKHITDTNSRPPHPGRAARARADAIREVVDAVRNESSPPVPRFASAPCPVMQVKAFANAHCGYLVVPEDRSRPAGRTIRLIVAIVPALSAQPAADPVVYRAVTVTIPVYWLNTRVGFDNLFRACAAEAACDAAHPHLEETFTGLVNKLEAEPLIATVSDPTTGEDTKVMLDGGALVDWLRNQSYSTPLLRAVPNLIGGLAAGRPEAIAAIAKDRDARAPRSGKGVPSAGYGLGFGVVCREQYPFATREDLIAAGRQAFPGYPVSLQDEAVGTWAYANDDCREVWNVPAAPAAVRQLPASGIPTLLTSGSFDAITSLDWTKAAAASLSNATIVSIPGIGHFVVPQSPCAQAVMASFLADPRTPDTSCVEGLTPPSFTSQASP